MNRRVIIFVFAGFIALDAIVLGVYWLIQRRFSAVQPAQAAVPPVERASASNHVAKGFAFQRNRQYAEAVAAFEAAVREQPDYSDAHHGLAQAQRETGELGAALSNHDRAIELEPGRHDLYWERGVTCQRMKDYDAAISNYKACLERKPTFANAHLGLGEVYRELGNLTESLSHLNQAIALKPDSDWFHRERGNTHRKMGNQQLADADFAKMRELQENRK